MGTLDGIIIGLICDFLLTARDQVENGIHPATSWGTRLGRLVGSNDCRVRAGVLHSKTWLAAALHMFHANAVMESDMLVGHSLHSAVAFPKHGAKQGSINMPCRTAGRVRWHHNVCSERLTTAVQPLNHVFG